MTTILTTLLNLVTALNQLITAVNNLSLIQKPCGGCGGNEIEPDPADNPGDPQIDPPPPSFSDWQEYDNYKCKVSNALISYWQKVLFDADSRDWDALATGGVAIMVDAVGLVLLEAGLAAVGVTLTAGPIIIAGLLIAVAVFIIGNIALDFGDMAQTLANNYDDLVCLLYTSQDTTAANDGLIQYLIDAGFTVPERQFMELLVTNHDLNKLFVYDAQLDSASFVPANDCSACQAINFNFIKDVGNTQDGNLMFGVNLFNFDEWNEIGGDDINEVASGGLTGNVICPTCPGDIQINHVRLFLSVSNGLPQNDGQKIEMFIWDNVTDLPQNSGWSLTAGQIGPDIIQVDIPGPWPLDKSGNQDWQLKVTNIGYPQSNQLQRIAVHWIGMNVQEL